MKKQSLAAVLLTLAASAQVYADTVDIAYEAVFSMPPPTATAASHYAFRGTNQIVFQVAGKTCTLVGSATAIGPKGCNYRIKVAGDGAVTGSSVDSNAGCTASRSVTAACK